MNTSMKLLTCQAVSRCEPMPRPRYVYEHVYETVDLSGSVEVRANATAKVCEPHMCRSVVI